jgi:hypothetical protein
VSLTVDDLMEATLKVGIDVFADNAQFLRALQDAASDDAELEAAYGAFMGLAQQTLLAIWSATAQYWRRAHT